MGHELLVCFCEDHSLAVERKMHICVVWDLHRGLLSPSLKVLNSGGVRLVDGCCDSEFVQLGRPRHAALRTEGQFGHGQSLKTRGQLVLVAAVLCRSGDWF